MSAVRETSAGDSEVVETVAAPPTALPVAPLLDPAALARAPLGQRAAAVAALQRSAGNGAVQQLLAREPAKAADPDVAGWKDKPFGETVYKEIIKKYTPEQLLKLALPQLSKLPKQIPEANSQAAASAAVPFAQKAAEEWMKTEGGKKFLADAATWVKQHPDAVYWTLVGAMAAAIAGAAIAYFSGAFAPGELDKKFKLLGFDIGAGADLGKFTEVILKSAKLSISRELGEGVSASVSGDVADGGEKGWSGSATGKLGSKSVYGQYQLKWDEKGVAGQSVGFGAYGLTGQYGWNKEGDTGQLEYKLKPLIIPIETTAMVKMNADGTVLLDASSLYKSAHDGSYKLGVKGPLAGGKPDEAMVFTFGRANTAGGVTASSEWSFNPTKPGSEIGKYDFKAPIGPGLTLTQAMKVGGGEVIAYDTKLTGEALKGKIKAELAVGQTEEGKATAGGGVTIKLEDAEWAVRAAFSDAELSELAMKMGFGGKEDAVKFLVDASLARKDGVDKMTLKAILTAKIGKFATKWELNASQTEGGDKPGASVGGSASFVYTLPKGVLVGASGDVKYDAAGGVTAGPGVLVGHEWSPVLLKGSVMVAPGGEAAPVWGLSAVGRF